MFKLLFKSKSIMFSFSLVKATYKQIFNLKLIRLLIIPFIVYVFIDLILFKSNKQLDFSGSWSTLFNDQNIALISRWFFVGNYIFYGFFGTLINGLNAVNKSEKFNFFQNFDPRKVFRLFKTSMISIFLTSAGFVFFIVPGIILTKRYLYTLLIALENKSLNVFESLKESKELSMNKGWNILLTLSVMIFGHLLLLREFMVPLLSTNGFLNIFLVLIYKWIVVTFPITFLYVSKEKFQLKKY